MNATAHIGNDSVIQNSIIGLKSGKIVLVADAKTANFDKTAYDEVIDATGKHVYPGIIAPNSTLGLTEIESVRATND
ncbi:MAG TPA: amidohydrolase, partial [Bacteroidia bacterium]|nr:amidohydrolase [Bacteroidia bacterium]